MKIFALALIVAAYPVAGCGSLHSPSRALVSSENQACELAKARVTELNRFPKSRIAFCDHVVAAANPVGYYVLALHSDRQCDGICSTNMG